MPDSLIRAVRWIGITLLSLLAGSVGATTCPPNDYTVFISGKEQCLVMRTFGSEQPETLVLWLHGDVSSGGPANYHFPIARRFTEDNTKFNVLSVALVRPGYPDGDGNASSAAVPNPGRRDHYTKSNIAEIAAAIEHLKVRFHPQKTFIVGHSGGAAMAATTLGMYPDLVDGAVLVSCPCDLVAWRAGRNLWSASENPLQWASRVPKQTKVYALTGSRDDNTAPQLAQDYVAALKQAGVIADFELLTGETHNSAFRASAVSDALHKLIESAPRVSPSTNEPSPARP